MSALYSRDGKTLVWRVDMGKRTVEPVEVKTARVASVIAEEDAVRVEHRDDLEDHVLAELTRASVGAWDGAADADALLARADGLIAAETAQQRRLAARRGEGSAP
jgi:hypothetical protein